MNLEWHRGASEDLQAAIQYYDMQSAGLGHEFLVAVDAAIDRILAGPDTFAFVDDEIRSCPVSRFPYTIHYRIDDQRLRILIVKHERRAPSFGSKRR